MSPRAYVSCKQKTRVTGLEGLRFHAGGGKDAAKTILGLLQRPLPDGQFLEGGGQGPHPRVQHRPA